MKNFNSDSILKEFQTPEFSGVWLKFSGDRMAFRALVQDYLRAEFHDSRGNLSVEENGPHWKSDLALELSYSHTENTAVLVFSKTHSLGVDIESEDREFKGEPVKLAARFFPVEEVELIESLPPLEQRSAFLKLWVQKEAYAKITRLGLAKTLELGMKLSKDHHAKSLPVSPEGFLSCVITKRCQTPFI